MNLSWSATSAYSLLSLTRSQLATASEVFAAANSHAPKIRNGNIKSDLMTVPIIANTPHGSQNLIYCGRTSRRTSLFKSTRGILTSFPPRSIGFLFLNSLRKVRRFSVTVYVIFLSRQMTIVKTRRERIHQRSRFPSMQCALCYQLFVCFNTRT